MKRLQFSLLTLFLDTLVVAVITVATQHVTAAREAAAKKQCKATLEINNGARLFPLVTQANLAQPNSNPASLLSLNTEN